MRPVYVRRTSYRPRAARQYAPGQWQFDSRRIYVRPRTRPQSAHLWWPAVAKLQAASVSIGWGSCAPRQLRHGSETDGSRYRLIPALPHGGGIIRRICIHPRTELSAILTGCYRNGSHRPHRCCHRDRLIAFTRWRQMAMLTSTYFPDPQTQERPQDFG